MVWSIGLFKELNFYLNLRVRIYYDIKAEIQIATNLVFHEHTKHIDVDCHFIREKVHTSLIQNLYVPTAKQPTDILTTGLGHSQYAYLVSKLGMKNIFIPPNLRGMLSSTIRSADIRYLL